MATAAPSVKNRIRPLHGTDQPPSVIGDPPVFKDLIRAHAFAGVSLLLVSVAFGLITAHKFDAPEFLGNVPALTWGRTRYNHVQGILLAWLMNAFFAFFYYAIPALRERPVFNRTLGWWLFWLWNLGVVALGWVLVMAGFSQSLEWSEFPIIVDVIALTALAGYGVQFLTPFLGPPRHTLYVSSWYIVLALVFTPFAYLVSQFGPQFFAPGAEGAAISGLWIHDAVGIVVTPPALAIAYYVIPTATGRPIYSHFLSMVGFWGLVFFYPMNGAHHYVFSPLPMSAQKASIVASMFMGMDVILVVSNLLLSLRGCGTLVVRNLSLRWVWTSIIFYLIVSLQGAGQSAMALQEHLHFSDWVIGHSHLAMAGFATFMAVGGITHFWRRITGYVPDSRLLVWAYWVSTVSLLAMVLDLTFVGLVQANLWMQGEPWINSVVASKIAWQLRTWSGVALTAGFVLVLLSLRRPRRDQHNAPGVEGAHA
jgi:cbb3-type cytochrome oxidase subunit 1